MRLTVSPRGARPRGGFTLVEMLVVISIVVVIIGVGVGATMRFREAAVNRAADDQLKQMQISLNDQYQAVVGKCHKDGPPQAVIEYCGGNRDRALAVHTAATLKAYFPDTFAEATTAFSINGQNYNNPPRGAFKQVNGSAGLSADQQAAVLLYLVLSEQAAGQGSGEVRSSEGMVKDAAGKEFKVFLDPWGTPVRYARWAQSSELDASPYTPPSGVSKDPLDPKNLVAVAQPTAGWPTTSITALNSGAISLSFVSRNRVPSVVGFGKDKAFGNYAAGADDRVGYRLNRQGNSGK